MWAGSSSRTNPICLGMTSCPPPPALPLLGQLREDCRAGFPQHFTLGNDPEERFFMHGRQGFRLLTVRYKKLGRPRFTRQVLFGIWRHSLSLQATDADFKFTGFLADQKMKTPCSIFGADLTPECQVVRYADDMSAVVDLIEGIKHGIIKRHELTAALEERVPDYERIAASLPFIAGDISELDAAQALTYFIGDFIRTNMSILKEERGPASMRLSDPAWSVLVSVRDVVKARLHKSSKVERGDALAEAQIMALCDWYYEHPKSLYKDLKELVEATSVPYLLADISTKTMTASRIFRCAVICDFVSMLTDAETRALSEPLGV